MFQHMKNLRKFDCSMHILCMECYFYRYWHIKNIRGPKTDPRGTT